MSADLERDLGEAGDGLRDVVAALRRAPQAHVPAGFSAHVLALLPQENLLSRERPLFPEESLLSPEGRPLPQGGGNRVRSWWFSSRVLLAVAASLLFAFVFVSLVFRSPAPSQPPTTSLASSRQESSGSPDDRQLSSQPTSQKVSSQPLDGSFSASHASRPFSVCQRPDGSFSDSSAAPYVQAFAVTGLAKAPSSDRAALDRAVDALVRTQKADGGWGNAALSARNVTALAQAEAAGVSRAREARRRGLRYLRIHGIGEISAADLAREAKEALSRLKGSNDAGLVCGVALASHGNMK